MRSTFALFYVAILEKFSWGRGPAAFGYSLTWLGFVVFGPVASALGDRFGTRKVVTLGGRPHDRARHYRIQIMATHQVAHAADRGFDRSVVVWLFAFGAGCTMAGNLLGGWLFDVTGSYRLAFTVAAFSIMGAAVAAWYAARPPRRAADAAHFVPNSLSPASPLRLLWTKVQ